MFLFVMAKMRSINELFISDSNHKTYTTVSHQIFIVPGWAVIAIPAILPRGGHWRLRGQ